MTGERREIWPNFKEDMPKWNGGIDYRNWFPPLGVLDIEDTVSLGIDAVIIETEAGPTNAPRTPMGMVPRQCLHLFLCL